MRGLRHRDKQLRRLEGELRANRSEPPKGFIRALLEADRGEARWIRPRLRVGLAVALVALALAAIASAGGFSVVQHGTRAAVDVIKRTTHTSAPRTLSASPGNKQYKKHCGTGSTPKCHITIFDSSVREGRSGTTTMSFTVSLDATNDAPVTVDYATMSGTAIGGTSCAGANSGSPDYISTSGTLTFLAGSPTQTITVLVCGDTMVEPNQTFTVTLSNPSPNADISRATATGTIVNDDH
jgi:Calx-beta domain